MEGFPSPVSIPAERGVAKLRGMNHAADDPTSGIIDDGLHVKSHEVRLDNDVVIYKNKNPSSGCAGAPIPGCGRAGV